MTTPATRVTLLTALLFALPLLLPAQIRAQDEDGERQQGNLRQVIRDLASEANEQLREDLTFPRSEPTYADDENLELRRREVIQTLGRRTDSNPVIDAYVKWQMLSFLDSLDEFSNSEYQRIMNGLPQFLPRAELTREQEQLFEQAAQARDPDLIPILSEANEQFEQNVAEIEHLNMPARAYRDALIDEMPLENGIRWFVRLQEVEQRFQVGELTYEDVYNRFYREVRQNSENADIPLQARNQIFDELERLADMRNDMVHAINILAVGDVNVHRIGRPQFRGRLDRVEEHLFPNDTP